MLTGSSSPRGPGQTEGDARVETCFKYTAICLINRPSSISLTIGPLLWDWSGLFQLLESKVTHQTGLPRMQPRRIGGKAYFCKWRHPIIQGKFEICVEACHDLLANRVMTCPLSNTHESGQSCCGRPQSSKKGRLVFSSWSAR